MMSQNHTGYYLQLFEELPDNVVFAFSYSFLTGHLNESCIIEFLNHTHASVSLIEQISMHIVCKTVISFKELYFTVKRTYKLDEVP